MSPEASNIVAWIALGLVAFAVGPYVISFAIRAARHAGRAWLELLRGRLP